MNTTQKKAAVTNIQVNNNLYIKLTNKNLETTNDNVVGFFKFSNRKGGKHQALTLFKRDATPFAAIINDNGSCFCVTATPVDSAIQYSFSATEKTEKELNLPDGYANKIAFAENIMSQFK